MFVEENVDDVNPVGEHAPAANSHEEDGPPSQESATATPRRVVHKHYNIYLNLIGHNMASAQELVTGLLNNLPSGAGTPSFRTGATEEPVQNILTRGPSTPWQNISNDIQMPWEASTSQQAQSPSFVMPRQQASTSGINMQHASTFFMGGQGQQASTSAGSQAAFFNQPPPRIPPLCNICCKPAADKKLKNCGHFVCKTCMVPWLRRRKSCPNPHCSAECVLDDLMDFHL